MHCLREYKTYFHELLMDSLLSFYLFYYSRILQWVLKVVRKYALDCQYCLISFIDFVENYFLRSIWKNYFHKMCLPLSYWIYWLCLSFHFSNVINLYLLYYCYFHLSMNATFISLYSLKSYSQCSYSKNC